MAVYKTKEFEAALLKKGYLRDSTHHAMYWYYLDGKKTSVRTRASNGEKEFDETMFDLRRKQMGGLSKEQLRDYVECRFTSEQYRQHLLDTGRITMASPILSAPAVGQTEKDTD